MKRKSLLFLLFLALGLPWAANAQETLTVCDGTTTNGKIPVNGLYVDTQGTTSEFIIPATTEGMSDMEGGTVSKLTFYVPNPPATWGSPTIQLYIGEVDYTTLSTLNGPTNFTVVATGVWDNTQTTIEVEFVTPYTYEGGNLLIGTYVQTKSSTYKTTNFAGVSAESGSSMYNNGSGSGTAQSFLPKTTFTYTPGGGSICEKPATMETSNVTSNSAMLTWTGGSGTYNLEYKLASAEDWTSLLTNTTATIYTLQGLNPDKAYQARVQSVCGEDVSGWKSVNFRTSFAIPLIEEFGTSIPTGWAMYTGLLENVMAGTAELTSTTYGWNFGEGNGVFDNHAYVNIYGSNCQKWLVMPTVTIEDSIQLQFDMALTAYNANMPEPSLTGIDDKFIVLINVGSNWTILRQWDNAGSEYVYNDIASPATGQTVSIDLSSYSGQQVAVAFYGESTESNADNNLHIDNVNITRVNATDLYIVTVSANPANGGMVSGGGEFAYGQTCTITATSTEGYSFVNWTENGEIVSTDATYSFTVNANRTLVANFIYDGGGSGDHTYVDLGMPSGLLWATCNVGANTSEEFGDYFAWGETQPKNIYDWSTYQHCMGSNNTLTKYCNNPDYGYNGFTDNMTTLLPEDDAATVNWGNGWHMPTREEWNELLNNTTYIWTTQNGVNGTLFTADNGNSLFLPAAGYLYEDGFGDADWGYYWSSSLYTNIPRNAWELYSESNYLGVDNWDRYCGQPVRPVRSSQNTSFIIDATANPTEGGTVTGSGTYLEGSLCTVTATPAEGYYFMNWTQGGTVVSSTATYSFVVEANVDLVANFAEGIYIGDGGTATSQYLPSYSYYNYSLTQQIYTAEEIGTSGMITSIAFFNGGAEKTRTYDFYMKHTTKSNFSSNTDWITVSPSDMVFSGSVTMVADGWTMIIFDTPFIYDGISNVVLVVDDNSGEWTSSPHMSCRVFDAEGPQAIYVYQDGTNFAPMSPPTSSTSNNDVLSVKNQIILGLGSASDFYVISATANPAEGGTVTGTGTFAEGATCTLTATPANGYEFLNWNENNQVVSVDAMYSFTVEGNRNLVANFGISIGTVTASYHPDPMNPESPYVMVTWGTNTDSFEAQIGDDTSTFGYFPFHTLYSYSIAENLFLATELVTVGVTTAPMTSLSWYATNTTGYNQEGISIWMANVDDETLTTNSHVVTDMTLVYRGAMTPLVGWNEFVFNQGTFAWDGHSNVLICCQRNNGNWNSSIQWQRHDAGFLAGAFNYTDTGGSYNMETMSYSMYTTTYRANIMFKSSINRENSVTYKVYRTDCDGNNYSLIADNVTSPFVDSLWLQLPVGSYQYGVNYINDEGNESEIVASNCIDRNLYTYQITATPNFEERGTVTGAGTYDLGSICTLTATANEGYHFVSWTKNGTIISVNPMYSFTVMQNAIYVANFSSSVHPGLLEGVFSTSENTQIRFSQGNLQYIGSASTPYWKFADNQWDYFGSAQNGTSSNVDRDLFGFAASGYDHGAVGYQPWSTSTSNDSYYAYGSWEYNLYDQTGQADWGYNAIINGGNQENLWRTPTKDEWVYIFNNRTTISGIRYARAVVNNVNGVILLPDNWNASIFTLNNVNMSSSSYSSNDIGATDWMNIFEPAGAVFLPAAGYRNGSSAGGVNENGDYWSSSVYSSSSAYIVNFRPSYLEPEYTAGDGRWYGRAARLVQTCTTSSYTIYIEPNPVEGGSVTGAGTYPEGSLCTLTAIANQGYTFVNWTKDNVEVSTESTYSFTVTENATYVANFILNQGEVTQENTLAQGYNWWSTYIEQEGINGLEMLENSLGGNGVAIRSQANGYTDYYGEDYGWWGSLTSINNESSYRVVASTPCTVTMTGTEAVPSQHPIMLNHGWTWMGYVPSTAMDVNTAMAGMEASDGDMLKSQQGYADYYPNYGWYGSLNTIEPGMGLMYYSTSGETVTFTYPDNSRGGELKANLTAENNHWKPNTFAYPDNMTVMAVVELEGAEITSDNYELAAFTANGECRGSVKLAYAEPLHRYVAFLTISGQDATELSFRLYDRGTGREYRDAEESLDFVANAIVGDATDLYVVHFRGTTGVDELAGKVQVYPNPVNAGERFSINIADDVKNLVRVEIVNALGVETLHATSVQMPAQLTAPATAGVYTLRITVEGKGTFVKKLVVK